jgi:hypothetical protein
MPTAGSLRSSTSRNPPRSRNTVSEPNSHVHGLETRSVRREKLTAGIDCTKILALPVHTSKISILIFLVIKAKKAERKKKLRTRHFGEAPRTQLQDRGRGATDYPPARFCFRPAFR